MRLFLLLLPVFLNACAAFQPSASVEALLKGSEALDAEIDSEEAQAAEGPEDGERAPASGRTVSFQWPLRHLAFNSPFGYRDGQLHTGVDLKASEGTPVYASAGGLVIYSGSAISGYGEVVLIRHGRGYSTLYAHNSSLLVSSGQRVRKGQCIAYSGDTGRASGPHLHFEIREGLRPIDPQPILTRRAVKVSR